MDFSHSRCSWAFSSQLLKLREFHLTLIGPPSCIFLDKVFPFILNILIGVPNKALLCTTLIVSSSGVVFCTTRIGLVLSIFLSFIFRDWDSLWGSVFVYSLCISFSVVRVLIFSHFSRALNIAKKQGYSFLFQCVYSKYFP